MDTFTCESCSKEVKRPQTVSNGVDYYSKLSLRRGDSLKEISIKGKSFREGDGFEVWSLQQKYDKIEETKLCKECGQKIMKSQIKED